MKVKCFKCSEYIEARSGTTARRKAVLSGWEIKFIDGVMKWLCQKCRSGETTDSKTISRNYN